MEASTVSGPEVQGAGDKDKKVDKFEGFEKLSESESASLYNKEYMNGTLFITEKENEYYKQHDKDYQEYIDTGKVLIDIGDVQHFMCVSKDFLRRPILLRCNRQRIHRFDHLNQYNMAMAKECEEPVVERSK